uniref:ANK_REP_REGION domain-containing protein n=1 Tax=Macrostomum lignano TaxID=282301 RepID=A0A1I8H373_9PLAT
MLSAAGIAVAAALACLFFFFVRRGRRVSGLEPPGPGGYPLIGSMFHLREPWFHYLYERFPNCGVLLMHFGTQRVYVLSRWAEFKAAMLDNAESLTGRPTQHITSVLFGDYGGIVASDGKIWRDYRRFTLQTLRDLGLGRRGVEEIVQEEAVQLLAALSSGKPVDTALPLSTASANVVCQLVFGSRLASEEPQFAELLEHFSRLTQNEESNVHNYIFMALDPLIGWCSPLVRLLSSTPASRQVVGSFTQLMRFCERQRVAHAAHMAAEPRDFIEAHMIRQAAPDSGVFNDTRLSLAVADLFIAGTDTTSNTLRWALLLMLRQPEAARLVREEIRREIGDHRLPGLQDRKVLNYTQATLEEVHRIASLVPLGLAHRLQDDISIGEYRLPRDSLVMFNVYAIHRDPDLFPEPDAFRPERHLGLDGRFEPCATLASFGSGRRSCLGEGLARTELFVFFSAIMQRFSFRLESSGARRGLADLMDRQANFSGALLRSLPPHEILFEPLGSASMEPDESDPFVDLSRALAVPAVELILFEMLPLGDRSAQELYHSICQFDNDMVRALLKDRPELANECRSRVKFQQKVNIEEESNTHTIELDDATPLHVATAVTNAEIIRDLLRAGANPVQPFTTFRAWINKASEATKPDVAMAGGVALHLGVLLDSYLCVRELASPDLYYARVRRLLLAPQPIGQSFCTAGMLDFLDWPLREMIVDNQFHLGGASPLQLASLLSSKGMIRQVILRYLQYYTMKYYLVRHEVPFTKFKNQLRFASDDTGVLDEIERGYALHLCLSMRSKESTATLIEFDDIYEIFVSCIYHRLEVAQKFLAECEAQGVQPDIAKLNEYLRLPGDKDLLPTGMERHDDAEFVNLWHRVVLPTVREVWTEMVEGTAFDLRRLGKPMRLESKADFAQHRARIRYWNENLTVFRSPVVVHQVSQDYAFQRDLGFYLTRLNKPDLVYMEGGNERRPLDYPVITGDIRTAKVLLSRGAKCTYIQNLWKMKDNDIVRATMTQPHWEEYYMDRANPCALFDNEPELVMAVMDRFVQVKKTTQDEDSNSQFEKIVLNYKFFDAELKQPRKEGVPHPILTLHADAPAGVPVHSSRLPGGVLPLPAAVFLTYFAFNILFTGHLINVSMIKEQNDASEYKKCLESGSNMTVHDMTWYKQNRFWTVGVVGYLKGFVIFFLIKEMLQLVVRKLDYFGLGNMIDLFVFVSILVLLHSHEHSAGCQYYSDSQWQLAAVVLFFTWFNVFLYFRKFPVFGVYIVMFLVILQNSVKFLFLFSVLVFAFAAQFHILMGNQLRFSNYWDACLKVRAYERSSNCCGVADERLVVFVMGTGELTFEEIFLEDQNSSSTLVAYDALSRAVFILFIVIIGIVTMNLLVGLAVDDISQIQRRAQLKRLALQADLSISILSRLYEFRRKFIKWWRERDEANILQLVLLFAFSAFLLLY